MMMGTVHKEDAMEINFVYITASSLDEAKGISRELVASRLAACANIIDNMHSMYWWEGEMQDDREVIIITKTKKPLVPALIEKVKAIHSYDCPCIVSLPVLDGNPPFLEWVKDETK